MAAITTYQALKELIVKALRFKATFRFAKEQRYGPYRFKEFIFPWARFFFPRLSRIATTDEAFIQEFSREDNSRYPLLLQEVGESNKTVDEQALILNQANKQAAAEELLAKEPALAEVAGKTTAPTTTTRPAKPFAPPPAEKATEEGPTRQPVPPAFEKAFENEPEYTTNPEIAPPPPPPRIPSPVINAAQNAASATQRSFYQNIGSRINPTSAINGLTNLLGGVGKGAGGAIGSGLGASAPALSKAGRGLINFSTNLTNQTSRLSSQGLFTPKNRVLVGALGIFVLMFGFSLLASIFFPNQNPTSSAETSSNGLDYTLPLKDPTIVAQDIRDQIKQAFPQAKLDYWDKIIQISKAAGLNPALALALWVEETGASQTTVVRNGGSGIPTSSGGLTLGHLGCAPAQDQTIDESLSCLIKFINTNNFSNTDFPTFMAKYSSGPPADPFANNPNFPTNLKNWYIKLVPSGVGAIQIITSQTVGTCPIPNGKITTASYDIDPINGHCGQAYVKAGFICPTDNPNVLPTQTRRAKSIDVVGGLDVFLPSIGGQSLNWKYLGVLPIAPSDCEIKDSSGGCGTGLIFQADLGGGHNWTLHLLHMDTSSATQFNSLATYSSGTKVGRLAINHLHMTVGKDITNVTARYDPGWLPSDFMCGVK